MAPHAADTAARGQDTQMRTEKCEQLGRRSGQSVMGGGKELIWEPGKGRSWWKRGSRDRGLGDRKGSDAAVRQSGKCGLDPTPHDGTGAGGCKGYTAGSPEHKDNDTF